MDKIQTTHKHQGKTYRLRHIPHWSDFLEGSIEKSTFEAVLGAYIRQYPGAVEVVNDDGSAT